MRSVASWHPDLADAPAVDLVAVVEAAVDAGEHPPLEIVWELARRALVAEGAALDRVVIDGRAEEAADPPPPDDQQ